MPWPLTSALQLAATSGEAGWLGALPTFSGSGTKCVTISDASQCDADDNMDLDVLTPETHVWAPFGCETGVDKSCCITDSVAGTMTYCPQGVVSIVDLSLCGDNQALGTVGLIVVGAVVAINLALICSSKWAFNSDWQTAIMYHLNSFWVAFTAASCAETTAVGQGDGFIRTQILVNFMHYVFWNVPLLCVRTPDKCCYGKGSFNTMVVVLGSVFVGVGSMYAFDPVFMPVIGYTPLIQAAVHIPFGFVKDVIENLVKFRCGWTQKPYDYAPFRTEIFLPFEDVDEHATGW